MTMDTQAPSPFARGTPAVGYNTGAAAYGQGYPVGQPYSQPSTDATAANPVIVDRVVAEARQTHARGAWIYLLAWVILGVSFPLLFASIGLAISALALSGTALDLLLAGLGLMAAGMAVRGVGFSLMMRADFIIRAHAWTGGR